MFLIIFPMLSFLFCLLSFSDLFLIFNGEIHYLRNRSLGLYRNLYISLSFIIISVIFNGIFL